MPRLFSQSGQSNSLKSEPKLDFDDLAGLDAAGANAHALAAAIDLRFYRLEVYVPAAAGLVVGVRDVVAELRAFAAEITFSCHGTAPKTELPEDVRGNFLVITENAITKPLRVMPDDLRKW
jgi:hypothetical protein